ncbi:E3 ubiquitin-protein ligase MARCHF6 [Bombina bombina]|uniref:E3 ubiquitin-protein ligase MARCHF6 n=2 Tax=Bombina bombina TaxID=8345 RepID=UPI00235B0B48|nr:E3 ubiquitin-protein ligase MARCHF6 [Bombina bombina]
MDHPDISDLMAPAAGNVAVDNVAVDQPANVQVGNAVVGENPEIQEEHADEEEEDNEDDDAAIEDAADANNGAQDDMNWNALEWDRAAEELTWERMLGLDGSLVFLEHVFWVVSLNTLFILVFGIVICITNVELEMFNLHLSLNTNIQGLAAIIRFQRSRRLLGICYIVVKVSLLVVVEIGVFPLICGWWLDICSLEMFDATLKDRELSFQSAPGTTMFLHWLVGMVYVFYFASFILLLREVLRPGVLWFLRNLNDPDFNPVQEMIHLPIYRHLRRFILSVIVFGSIVLLMLWLPIRIIKTLLPTFLPYNVMLYSDAPVSELSLELLLLQVVLPALLEQGHTRQWLKGLVRAWTVTAGYLLWLKQEDEDDFVSEKSLVCFEAWFPSEYSDCLNFVPSAHFNLFETVLDVNRYVRKLTLQKHFYGMSDTSNSDISKELEARCDHAKKKSSFYPVHARPKALDIFQKTIEEKLTILSEKNLKKSNNSSNLTASEKNALKSLSDNETILIRPSDKGGNVVVLNKKDYIVEARRQLDDKEVYSKLQNNPTKLYKHELGSKSEADSFCEFMNHNDDGIRFVGENNAETINFLDLKISANMTENKIETSLYRKPTAGNTLLSFKSCHPKHVLKGIPKGEYIRARRNCTNEEQYEENSNLITNRLRQRGYTDDILDEAKESIKDIPREHFLKYKKKENQVMTTAPKFITTYSTDYYKICDIIRESVPILYTDPILKEIVQQGINFIPRRVFTQMCFGCVNFCSFSYCFLVVTPEMQNLVQRRIYPFLLMVVILMGILSFQIRQFKRLYEHIKNDKYLVGQRLVNYERKSGKSSTSTHSPQTTQE